MQYQARTKAATTTDNVRVCKISSMHNIEKSPIYIIIVDLLMQITFLIMSLTILKKIHGQRQ